MDIAPVDPIAVGQNKSFFKGSSFLPHIFSASNLDAISFADVILYHIIYHSNFVATQTLDGSMKLQKSAIVVFI